jgi:CBS domain-containing protein
MSVIRDIMTKSVLSIRPEATMMDAVRFLTEHEISGVPVTSAEGSIVGFISEPSLMDVLFDEDVRKAPVSDYMSRNVHLVRPEDSISSAATMFALYGIRRLPVVENGRLIGVVTRRDLLAYALSNAKPLSEPLMELIPALGQFA